jgi:hypothetical protein
MKKIFILLTLIMTAAPAYAWQHVSVHEPLEQEPAGSKLRDRAMHSGFRQAVSLEMDRMMSGELSSERMSALMDHISGSIQGIVQGYRQVAWEEHDDFLTLEMEVNIDTDALRSLLQKTGAYYTSAASWPYDLNTRGASPEDLSPLRELQLISGTAVDGNAPTTLTLNRQADGSWSGNIVHGDISFAAEGVELRQVWFELWGRFFSRPEIKSGFVEDITLITKGWHTTDSINYFDQVLGTWIREVEHKMINSVYFGDRQIEAVWEIQSLSPESFKARIEKHLGFRGIDHQVTSVNSLDP